MPAIEFIYQEAKWLLDELGVIRGLKNKVTRRWDEAGNQLVVALDEISLIYAAIDGEICSYLALDFQDDQDSTEGRPVLLRLEAHNLGARLEEARGHCHKIGKIYQTYLNPWFNSIRQKSEAERLHLLFRRLSMADDVMLRQVNELQSWLPPIAQRTLNAVYAGNLAEANAQIRTAREKVLPTRRAVSELLAAMRGLQAEFIGVSSVT